LKLNLAARTIKLNRNQTYRKIAAYFIAAMVLQVFVLQSVDHIFGHHHHVDLCAEGDVHIHSIEDKHFSCDICLFQLSPSELEDCNFKLEIDEIVLHTSFGDHSGFFFEQRIHQNHVRGPPYSVA
jgi:hypothetical protein